MLSCCCDDGKVRLRVELFDTSLSPQIEQTLTGEDGGQWGEYLRLFTLLVLLGVVQHLCPVVIFGSLSQPS